MDIEKIKRRLIRLQKQRDTLADKHSGRETEYTYHGGYELGHLEGRINALESVLDESAENHNVKVSGPRHYIRELQVTRWTPNYLRRTK